MPPPERQRVIPQRELRNCVSQVLREVEAGAAVRITVRGRAVADLVPIREPRRFVPGEELAEILARTQADPDLAQDLDDALGQTIEELAEPWEP